jgi:hypothetical protein
MVAYDEQVGQKSACQPMTAQGLFQGFAHKVPIGRRGLCYEIMAYCGDQSYS